MCCVARPDRERLPETFRETGGHQAGLLPGKWQEIKLVQWPGQPVTWHRESS